MYLSLQKNGDNVSVKPVPSFFRRASYLCLAGQGGLDCAVPFHFCKVDTDSMFQQKDLTLYLSYWRFCVQSGEKKCLRCLATKLSACWCEGREVKHQAAE